MTNRDENALAGLRAQVNTLMRRWSEQSHAFWLHVDADKLEEASRLIESINDAITEERLNPK